MKTAMRLGIIGSSGGGALGAADECLLNSGKDVQWVVVTDRPCGLEAWASEKGYCNHRIGYGDAIQFSEDAFRIFDDEACSDILLFYTRRVAAPLIDKLRVWNIHPALLPSFPGLHAVKDAFNAGVKIFGATLHRVDAGLDTGPIVAQIAVPLSSQTSLAQAEHLSYLQKVWLTLVWVEHLRAPNALRESHFLDFNGSTASHFFQDEKLRSGYKTFLDREMSKKGMVQ